MREPAHRGADEAGGDRPARLERNEAGDEEPESCGQGERGGKIRAAQSRDQRPQAAHDTDGERRHPGIDDAIHGAGVEEIVRAHRPAVEGEQDHPEHGDRLGGRGQRPPPQQ